MLQEYQFRGILKSEWNNLFNFIQAKRLRIENVAEAEMGPSGAVRPALDIDLGEDIDTGLALLTCHAVRDMCVRSYVIIDCFAL